MSLRKNREQAFWLIFEKSFNNYEISEIIELAAESRELDITEEAGNTATAVFEHLEEIDAAIDRNLNRGWSRTRISKVAMALLRLSAYELMYVKELDTGISLNEAVILAKRYATPEDAAFINGVLSSIAKQVR